MNIRVVMYNKSGVEHFIEKEKLSRKDYEIINSFLSKSKEHHVQIYWITK